MATFRVGRAGFDMTLSPPASWDMNGDVVSFNGEIHTSTLADAQAQRQQLLGHMDNPDEPVVPITWSDDTTVAGFYRIRDVKVTTVRMSLTTCWFPFSVTAERVPGYQAPLFETVITGALRVNSAGITSTDALPWIALGSPEIVAGYSLIPYAASASGGVRAFADELDGIYPTVTSTKADLYGKRVIVAGDPIRWYPGAAKIHAGTGARVMVGRQIPPAPYGWKLSNGLVRVTPVLVSSAYMHLDIEWADTAGGTWETARRFVVGQGPSGITPMAVPPTSVTVLRNAPEECVIRMHTGVGNALGGSLDLGLRRGSRYLTGIFNAVPGSGLVQYGVGRSTSEAATSLTGGIRATSNDAGGNRYVLASAKAIDKELTGGSINLTTGSTSFDFMIGSEIGGSGATGTDAAQDLIYQYMGAVHERRLIVAG